VKSLKVVVSLWLLGLRRRVVFSSGKVVVLGFMMGFVELSIMEFDCGFGNEFDCGFGNEFDCGFVNGFELSLLLLLKGFVLLLLKVVGFVFEVFVFLLVVKFVFVLLFMFKFTFVFVVPEFEVPPALESDLFFASGNCASFAGTKGPNSFSLFSAS